DCYVLQSGESGVGESDGCGQLYSGVSTGGGVCRSDHRYDVRGDPKVRASDGWRSGVAGVDFGSYCRDREGCVVLGAGVAVEQVAEWGEVRGAVAALDFCGLLADCGFATAGGSSQGSRQRVRPGLISDFKLFQISEISNFRFQI